MRLPNAILEPVRTDLLVEDFQGMTRATKRLQKLLREGVTSPNTGKDTRDMKRWSLDFLLSPRGFLSSRHNSSQLAEIEFVQNKFEPEGITATQTDRSARVSHDTDKANVKFSASMAFRSIGYKSEPLNGMQDIGILFDERKGIIQNDGNGRATSLPVNASGEYLLPGIYCAGWVKRGPAGVIANTLEDANATADAMIQDWQSKSPMLKGEGGWDAMKAECRRRGLKDVNWEGWKRIESAENERGKHDGKEREKLTSVQQMLEAAG